MGARDEDERAMVEDDWLGAPMHFAGVGRERSTRSRSARFESVSVVTWPSEVRASPRSVATIPKAKTTATSHAPIVSQGCRLLQRARCSVTEVSYY